MGKCFQMNLSMKQEQTHSQREQTCVRQGEGEWVGEWTGNLQVTRSYCRHSELYSVHGLQYASLPCPSPSPGVCSNMCPLSQWCHPTILSSVTLFFFCLQSFHSNKVFSNELALPIRWSNYWSFSINPSNEYSGLFSFRVDWFYLFEVHRTLKSLLQHHSSKATILHHSAFFMVQLTSLHDYWENHSFDYTDLCRQSNVSVF